VSARARALALLGVAAVCAGAAASIVNRYAGEVRAQVGPPVSVLVAARDIPRGKVVTFRDAASFMKLRQVPRRFAPPDGLRSASAVIGLRALAAVPAGAYLTTAQFARRPVGPRSGSAGADRRRVVEVSVAGAAALAGSLQPGMRVDVLITSARGAEPQRTYLALQRVELVSFAASGGEEPVGGDKPGDALAVLRVTLRQAVLLTAAQNFASELRLLPRAPGDDRLFGPAALSAADLHP
jgi:pilus assembly protein CpaB